MTIRFTRQQRTRTLMLMLVLLLACVCVAPLYWMLTGSFKKMASTMKVPPDLIPLQPTLDNYAFLFNGTYPVLKWLLNSFTVAALSTLFCILVCTMMGYAFAKKDFPLKNGLFLPILISMMLPIQASLIPLFLTVKSMGLMNHLMGAVVPLIVWPYGIFMMRQFLGTLPNDLLESARMDGATEILIFRKVVLPLAKPAVAALGVIFFLIAWNDFLWQMIVLKDVGQWTYNIGISVISRNPVGNSPVINYGLSMAGGTLGAVPVVLLFVFLQKYFVTGLTMGAVKA